MDAGVHSAELIGDPLEGIFRIETDDAFVFLEEARKGGEIVVNGSHTPTAFWGFRLLRMILYEW